ncbi:MAG: hypothetical protein II730_09195 [Bacteroidales bacterium]|nr:hypothetical protein [Bacteroidales bacterium]
MRLFSLDSFKFFSFAAILSLVVSCSAARPAETATSSLPGRMSWSVSVMRGGSALLTGLCIADVSDIQGGKDMKGTFVNEFGVRAFDFKAERKPSGKTRVKILSPMKALSNPVLRHVLGKDLAKVFSSGELLECAQDEFPYRCSSASGMEYVFSPSAI